MTKNKQDTEKTEQTSKIPKLILTSESTFLERESQSNLYVILDNCYLEVNRSKQHLITSEQNIKTKHNKKFYRPDILHHCLLNLTDSPINKLGRLQIYIKLRNNELIYLNKKTRIPRTYSRFDGLFSQLLTTKKIVSVDENKKKETLLKIVKNDLSMHLPTNCLKIGLTDNSEKTVLNFCPYFEKMNLSKINDNIHDEKLKSVAFFLGAYHEGDDNLFLENGQYSLNDKISMGDYKLSAGICCAKITNGVEQYWGI